MNSFLLALTAVLILVLGALFAAPVFIDWNDYRPVFETQTAKLIGRDVKVGGAVHLVVLPAPELRFDDVKVADEKGSFDQPLLEAKSIEAWLNISALLRGAVEARKITVSEPVLRLALREDGSFNLNDIGRAGANLPFAPKEVMLDEIGVSGGRVELSRAGKPVLAADNVAGTASAGSLSGPYKVSASYDFDGRRQELRLATGAADADGKFRLKTALRDPDRDSVYLFDGDVTGLREKPSYAGSLIYRIAPSLPAGNAQPAAQPQASASPPSATPAPGAAEGGEPLPPPEDNVSALELKGDLNANPDHAELPSFELAMHAQGRSQMLKGSLALDFGDRPKATGALSARWLDADALLAEMSGGELKAGTSLVGALEAIAETALGRAATLGDGALQLNFEQVSLGGDLIGNLDLAATAKDGAVKIDRLKADLPGETHLDASGSLTKAGTGPVFEGPIKLDGSKLGTLARWAAGERGIPAQATEGAFALAAKTTLGGGGLRLDDAAGELSGNKFAGALQVQGGDRRRVDLTLDSDRLDLRDLMGDGAAWRSWLPAPDAAAPVAAGTAPAERSLLAALRDDEVHVAMRVGELVLPSVPPGSLDAKFTLARDTLDIERLDYAAVGAVTIGGKGHIDGVSTAPSGSLDAAIAAKTPEGLRVGAGLLGLPESMTKSKELGALAPLDLSVVLTATREDAKTAAVFAIKGTTGGSEVALSVKALGEPANLAQAAFDIDGTVDGYRPQAMLGLFVPGLASERLAATTGDRGRLTIAAHGVPASNLGARVELATASLQAAFDGQGALKDDGIALDGSVSLKSGNAAIAFVLAGLEPSPSATGLPLDLRADIAKSGGKIELTSISGEVAGGAVAGNAEIDLGGKKTRFRLDASSDTVSLPALLGALVAWQRTPSTEEVLGTIAQNASQMWPARGFALQPVADSEGEIAIAAKTLSLGAPFQIGDAILKARVDVAGLTVTDLEGDLFGGSFAASGTLSPKGAGAELKAHAELAQGDLGALTQALAGRVLAKGPFTLGFDVGGEGLSPPGLVAGLSGEGTLFLDPGVLQTLSAQPLKRVAADANRTAKLDKDQVEAKLQTLRDTLTTGTYAFTATDLPFEVKNGTLKFAPSVLAAKGAATAVNGYIELASLRLDSEWAMRLSGAKDADLPPVSLVLAGAMSDAGAIVPSIDTAPLEDYLTVSRMQSDVERLETLDVSGRTQPAAAAPEPAASDQASDADDESDQAAAATAPSDKLAADKAAIERRAADRAAARIAEAKRLAEEKAATEKAAAEKAAALKLAAEKAAAEKAAEEKRVAAEKAAAEQKRVADEKAEADRLAAEKLAAEKAAAAKAAEEKRIAQQKAAAEKAAEQKRLAEEKAAAAKLAAEKRAAEKAAAKAAAAQAAEEKRLAAQAAAEKRAADKAAAEQAAAKAAEDKRQADAQATAEKSAAAPALLVPEPAPVASPAPARAEPRMPSEALGQAPSQAPSQAPPVAASAEPSAADPLPWNQDQGSPAPDGSAAGVAPDGQADTSPAATAEDLIPVVPPKPKSKRPKPAPDDWKKGISIFGGG